jgi:CxxC motif-containing protein (DUF1111 family)
MAYADDDHGRGGPGDDDGTAPITVIATGIPGAGAIAQINKQHLGSPFGEQGNPAFIATTAPGQIMDPIRLFVASSSNFGAPISNAAEPEGAILSVDPRGGTFAVPAAFAASSTLAAPQPSDVGGRVKLFTGNSPAFSNNVNYAASATVVTKQEVGASLPTAISLNAAFGRPWFGNAPAANLGTVSVIDPNGRPFAGSPSLTAGGVFAGAGTNRNASSVGGLTSGVLGLTLGTKAPDGTGRAVFFAVMADGSVEQINVQFGDDQLAPPGTIAPLPAITTASANSTDPHVAARAGVALNWAPSLILYLTDPSRNQIVALSLGSDPLAPGAKFNVQSKRIIRAEWLNNPIDVAGASIESADRSFATSTTVGANSDLFVLNRGDNTIVRMDQTGRLLARRHLDGVLPGMRANGIAVNDTGRTIYVTVTLPGGQGALLSTPTFGATPSTVALLDAAEAAGATTAAQQGEFIFSNPFTVAEGVGPLFNNRACVNCHNTPDAAGMGSTADSFVVRVGGFDPHGNFHVLESGPVARQHSIAELGVDCGLPTGVPHEANVTSVRSAPTLHGSSKITNISDDKILANMAAEPAAVRGHANLDAQGRVGKFGWKAQIPTLVEFMGDALKNEMGVTNPVEPDDVHGCGGCSENGHRTDVDSVPLTALVAYLDTEDPADSLSCNTSQAAGAALFSSAGCSSCHTPVFLGPGSPTSGEKPVRLYSDLLVHDMGPTFADGVPQGQAGSSEFRTAPLWRAATRTHFLHDGRAATVSDAIAEHAGQGAAAAAAFNALSPADQAALLAFINCI